MNSERDCRLIPSLLLALLLLALSPRAGQAETVGTLLRAQGYVHSQQREIRVGDPLAEGQILATGDNARAEILLHDRTRLVLGERAEFQVQSFHYHPDLAQGHADLRLDQGAFLLESGNIARLPGKPLRVATPLATIGIRGTRFWGGHLDHPLDVLVLDGAVFVQTPGGLTEVPEGLGTQIRAGEQTADAPAAWTPRRIQRAMDSVRFQDPSSP